MELKYYQHNGVGLRVRSTTQADYDTDVMIVKECQRHYHHPELNLMEQQYIVDIGAHIGAFSLWCLKHNPSAQIIAVDMDAENSAVGMMNLAGLAAYRHARVGYTTGAFEVQRWVGNSGSARVVPVGTPHEAPDMETLPFVAPTVTLEDLLEAYAFPRVDVLKIDAECAEYDILPNLADATLGKVHWIVGEYHYGIAKFEAEIMPRLAPRFRVVRLDRYDHLGCFVLERVA